MWRAGKQSRRGSETLASLALPACAQDDDQHVRTLRELITEELASIPSLRVVLLQAVVISQLARVQGAFRALPPPRRQCHPHFDRKRGE